MVRRFFSALRTLRLFRKRRADVNWRLVRRLAPRQLPAFRQLRQLRSVLSPREARTLAALAAVAFIAMAALAGRFVLGKLSSVPARGGQYVEGIVGQPQLLNPLYAPANDVDADLTRLLYAGLLRMNASGVLEPDLAESWSVSPDGKTYTLELREGAQWSDGSPITIEDVVFTFDAVKNPEWKSPLARAFRGVAVERKGERGVAFTLSESYSPFAQALTLGLLPEQVWGNVRPQAALTTEFNVKPIGAGPFRFKQLTRDRAGAIKTYTLERNEWYHGAAPYLDRIIVKFFGSFEEAGAALAARQVDGVGFLPLDVRREVGARGDLANYRLALPQLTAVFFNLGGKEFLSDLKVRTALALAVNREVVVSEALKGEGEGIGGPMPPGSFPGIGGLEFAVRDDLAAAAKLLDEAGWKIPAGSRVREKVIRDKKGRVTASSTLALDLSTVDRSETVAAARAIAEQWKALGVDATVSVVPASKIQKEVIRPRAFDALLYGEILGADPDPYPFWHSSQTAEGGLNLSGYKNRDVDTLLEAARRTADPALRAKKYSEFQKIVAREYPAIFLYRPFYVYVIDRGVRGVNVEHVATPADRWNRVIEWYRKTRPTFGKNKN